MHSPSAMAAALMTAYDRAIAAGRPDLPPTVDCLLFELFAADLDALYAEAGEAVVMRLLFDVKAMFREMRAVAVRRRSGEIS